MITKYSKTNILDNFLSDFIFSDIYHYTPKSFAAYSNSADLVKNDNNYCYKAIATGLDKEDLSIVVEENTLIISTKDTKESSLLKTSLNHKVKLREKVDSSNITAKLDKGILEISLPFDTCVKEKTTVKFI
jgi:HSP20 family molecular chaperone IbpA